MKANELKQLHDAFLLNLKVEDIELTISDIPETEQKLFIRRLWELFEHNKEDIKNHTDWTTAQGELLMLSVEQKGQEQITSIFNCLSHILHKSAPSVQFKYYKTLKKMEGGLSLQEALSGGRGKRGKDKKTINKENNIKNELFPEDDIYHTLSPQLQNYIYEKARFLAEQFNLTANPLTLNKRLFFIAKKGRIIDSDSDIVKSKNIEKAQEFVDSLTGYSVEEKNKLKDNIILML